MDEEGLEERVTDPQARIERAVGILEDHLEVAPRPAQLAPGEREEVLAAEADRAAGRLDETHDHPPEGALARPRLPHQGDGLARRDVEIDAGDRRHRSAAAGAGRRERIGNSLASPRTSSSALMRRPRRAAVRGAADSGRRALLRARPSGGRSAAQRSIRAAQRGAKTQPGGSRSAAGTWPGIVGISPRGAGWPSTGIDARSARA